MIYRCPQCGELFAADMVPLAQCLKCNTLLRVSPVQQVQEPIALEAPVWEAADKGVVQRFVGTCRQMARATPQFFFALGEKPSPRAEWFAYVAALLGIAGYFAGQLALLGQTEAELTKFLEGIAAVSQREVRPGGLGRMFAWGLALSPFLALVPLHVAAGLYHAGLFVLGLRAQPYEVTFRAAAYGMAPMVLLAVPSLGVFIAPGWIIALHWVGMAAAHRIPLGVAFLAITLPLLTFFLFAARFLGQLLLLVLTSA